MGKASMLLVAGTVILSYTMLSNAWKGNSNAEQATNEQSYKTLARQAALTGLNLTIHKLDADEMSWSTNADRYTVDAADYRHATYDVDVTTPYGSAASGGCTIDTVDVVITGQAGGTSHKIEATYARACTGGAGGLPPGFGNVAAVGDGTGDDAGAGNDLVINGRAFFYAPSASENANIHTNGRLVVNGDPLVQGYGSFSVAGGLCDTCDGFLPNIDSNGSAPNVFQAPVIPIPTFNVTDYEAGASYVHNGDFVVNAPQLIDFTSYQGVLGLGTALNPFKWYIKGDLIINSDALRMVGYAIIYVEGYLYISGDAEILSSLPVGAVPPTSTYRRPNIDLMRTFIATFMSEGTTTGIYVGGTKDDKPDEPGIHIDGSAVLSGQLFANGAIHINDKATFLGSMVTRSGMHINAKAVHWFVGANPQIIPPEWMTAPGGPAEQSISMLKYAEW